jgi:tripartite-type tricarboxylate transporter receptor subunit TctC
MNVREHALAKWQLRLAACCAASLFFAQTLHAASGEAFPQRPLRMLVAAAAGSGPDILARQVGAKLTESWGQQVVVDPRPGASGLIGAELVARSTPDGYTLWMATMTQLISTTLQNKYRLAREFTAIGKVATTPYVIATNAAVPVKSIAELVEYTKARPRQLLYGSAGEGSTPHLCMEIFRRMAGLDLVHVPYKSSVPALRDMMGGQIHMSCAAAPAMQAFVKTGKVRALGVTSAAPTLLAPGLAPIGETVAGYELMGWYGLLAPPGTPHRLVERINTALVKALGTRELQERLVALGAEAAPSSAAAFSAFLRKETGRWEKVLLDAGIKPKS